MTTRRFFIPSIFLTLSLFFNVLVCMESKYLPEKYRCEELDCPSCHLLRAMPTLELCVAAAQADVKRLRALLAESPDLSRCDAVGNMPPFFHAVEAAIHGRPRAHEAMRLLAEHGADVNAVGWDEVTPLEHAFDECNTNVMRELVRLGADLEWPCCSCRHSINERLSCECVRPTLLFKTLRLSADILLEDTPDEARRCRFVKRAVTLIECGARTDAVDFGYLLHLKSKLMRSRALLFYGSGQSPEEGDALHPWRSCYNLIDDAVCRRQAVDSLVGCDVARKARMGTRLLPRELICHTATFLGIELPLQKLRTFGCGTRKRPRSAEDA